jgi:molybdopterin synthase sulfur carrier subunit
MEAFHMADDDTITVKFATALAVHTGDQKAVDCRLAGQKNLASVLDSLDEDFPGIRSVICGDGNSIVDSINVYVNGDNVRYLQGLETPLKPGDAVYMIPAAAAG